MTQTFATTRATIRGRSPRKGETIGDLIARATSALSTLGFDAGTAAVSGAANSPRSFAVEVDVTLPVDGYDGPAVAEAVDALVGRLPADLRFQLRSWSPATPRR